jgi:hypothetical protein
VARCNLFHFFEQIRHKVLLRLFSGSVSAIALAALVGETLLAKTVLNRRFNRFILSIRRDFHRHRTNFSN